MAPINRNKRKAQTSAPEPAASIAAAPKVHRKFDDDDTPEVIEPAPVAEEVAEDSESASDSDDDAPEAVSTSAGRDAAATREEAAAKAIEAQEAAKRSKRKARDVKLQEQKSAAKETKKRRKVEVVEEPIEEEEEDESESEDDEDTEMGGVKLLPASLLEKLSDERRTPPKEGVKATHTRMQDGALDLKRLKRKERDVVVDKGVVSVKVLKNEAREKKLLPPKAVGSVVGRRNNMMRGRVERRSVGKAFVVKSAF